MNIKQAKEYIENTVRLYLKKDEFGEYRIPVVRQRHQKKLMVLS